MLIYSNLRFPPINSDSETYRDKRLSAGVLARLSGKHTLPISGGWVFSTIALVLPPLRLVTTGLLFRFFGGFFHLGPLSRYRFLRRKRRSSKTVAGKLVSCGERRLGRRFEVGQTPEATRSRGGQRERERERGTPNS